MHYGGEPPSETECQAILHWFNQIAGGAVLLQWVLEGNMTLNMNGNVIAFMEKSSEILSPLILKQIDSIDCDVEGEDEV